MQTSPEFELCLPYTLAEEGGNSNDPHDPGGRTHKGIIQREYDSYRRSKGLALRSDFSMSDDEVREIYWTQYWLPHCQALKPGLNLSVFDNCVNEGPFRATVLLQHALAIDADGAWGEKTQAAVDGYQDTAMLIMHYSDQRERFYRELKTFAYFGKGWLHRVRDIQTASLKMAQKGTAV